MGSLNFLSLNFLRGDPPRPSGVPGRGDSKYHVVACLTVLYYLEAIRILCGFTYTKLTATLQTRIANNKIIRIKKYKNKHNNKDNYNNKDNNNDNNNDSKNQYNKNNNNNGRSQTFFAKPGDVKTKVRFLKIA